MSSKYRLHWVPVAGTPVKEANAQRIIKQGRESLDDEDVSQDDIPFDTSNVLDSRDAYVFVLNPDAIPLLGWVDRGNHAPNKSVVVMQKSDEKMAALTEQIHQIPSFATASVFQLTAGWTDELRKWVIAHAPWNPDDQFRDAKEDKGKGPETSQNEAAEQKKMKRSKYQLNWVLVASTPHRTKRAYSIIDEGNRSVPEKTVTQEIPPFEKIGSLHSGDVYVFVLDPADIPLLRDVDPSNHAPKKFVVLVQHRGDVMAALTNQIRLMTGFTTATFSWPTEGWTDVLRNFVFDAASGSPDDVSRDTGPEKSHNEAAEEKKTESSDSTSPPVFPPRVDDEDDENETPVPAGDKGKRPENPQSAAMDRKKKKKKKKLPVSPTLPPPREHKVTVVPPPASKETTSPPLPPPREDKVTLAPPPASKETTSPPLPPPPPPREDKVTLDPPPASAPEWMLTPEQRQDMLRSWRKNTRELWSALEPSQHALYKQWRALPVAEQGFACMEYFPDANPSKSVYFLAPWVLSDRGGVENETAKRILALFLRRTMKHGITWQQRGPFMLRDLAALVFGERVRDPATIIILVGDRIPANVLELYLGHVRNTFELPSLVRIWRIAKHQECVEIRFPYAACTFETNDVNDKAWPVQVDCIQDNIM